MLKIFNTLNNKKEFLNFNNKKIINLYVCGVTVSDYCHIGHARTFYFFDILIKYLKYLNYKCNYIRNITDIDDKIILNSYKYNISIKNFSNLMILNMNKDFKDLDFKKPNFEPKISNYINLIIFFIKKLIKDNYAYISYNGDVLFNIKKIKNYGMNILKNFNIIKNNINNSNFVLWKLNINSKIKYFGWNSPWGIGRPGWHIECSIMSYKYLKNIDIHGGGLDLIFPHHENEFILSKCLFKNKYLVKYWMHTGMVINNMGKLSKSKNNFFKIKNLLKIYHPDIIKFFLMSTHYRKNLNFNFFDLNKAKLCINKIYFSLRNLDLNISLLDKDIFFLKKFDYYFNLYMNNDFNIPKIYCLFFNMINKINILKKKKNYILASKIGIKLKRFANLLGLLNDDSINYFLNKKNKLKKKIFIIKINKFINLRNKARLLKKWKLADWIRNRLLKNNISIEDNEDITNWYFN